MWLSTAAGLRGEEEGSELFFFGFPAPFLLTFATWVMQGERHEGVVGERKNEKQKEEEVKVEVTSFELIQKWGNRISMDRTEMWGHTTPHFLQI